MIELGGFGIGWRDLVLVTALLVGIYLVLTVMRLFQVAARRRPTIPTTPTEPTFMTDPQERAELYGEPEDLPIAPPIVSPTPAAPPPKPGKWSLFGRPSPVPVAVPETTFASELNRSHLDGELERLHREGEQLREQVAHLSEEVSRLKAARNVSPLYNEAMSLAQQGMPPEGIAGHCGISLGEAELVAALSKSEEEFERENLDEDRDDRYPNSGNRRTHG